MPRVLVFIALLVSLTTSVAIGAPAAKGLSLQASIRKPDGSLLSQSASTVKLQVLTPVTNCVLMEETHSNVNITDGNLNLVIGKGTRVPAASGSDRNLTLAEILDNSVTRTGLDQATTVGSGNCAYSPSAHDTRIVRVSLPVGGGDTLQADFTIRSTAYAVESERLEGKSAADFVQVNAAKKVTQANIEDFFNALTASNNNTGVMWNGTGFTSYDPSTGSNFTNGSIPWTKLTSIPAPLTQFIGLSCTTGEVLKYSSGAWICATDATGGGGGGITSLNSLTGSTQTLAVGASGTAPAFSSSGSTHTLNLPMASTAGVTAGMISKTDYDNFTNKLSGTVSVANGGTGATSLSAGNLLVGNGTSAVTTLASGSAGNILYGTGIAAWASGSPDTAGLVDKSTTQTISGAKAFSNSLTMNAQNEVRFADSDSSNYVSLRAPATVAANRTFTLPDVYGTSGQVLTTDGAGILSWSTVSGSSSAGGSSGDVQINNGSSGFTATGDFTYNTTSHQLTLNTTNAPTGNALVIAKVPASSATKSLIRLGPNDLVGASASGTYIGVNAASNTADFLNYQVGNNSLFSVDPWGNLYSRQASVATGGYPSRLSVSDNGQSNTDIVAIDQDDQATRGLAIVNRTYFSTNATKAMKLWQTDAGVARIGNAAQADPAGISIDPLGNVGIGTASPARLLQIEGPMRLTPAALPGTPGAGDLAIDSGDSNKLKYYDGSSWQIAGGSSGGITSINSLSGASQTLAVSATGSSLTFNSVGSTHTLQIPMASTAAVTAGLISKTDYDAFTAKLGTSSTFAGDVSGNSGAMSVDKIKGKDVVPAAYSAGQVLQFDGTNWVNAALSATSLTGTLAVANGGTGATSLASGNILIGGGTGAVTSLAAGSAGNVPYATGAATWASGSPDTAGLVDKSSTQTIAGAKFFGADLSLILQHALLFKDADSSNYVALRAPATVAADRTFTLPGAYGSNGDVLTSDGTGNLSWTTPASGLWTTGVGGIYYSAGNVGIGTNSPSAPLNIYKATGDAGATIHSAAAGDAWLTLTQSDTSTWSMINHNAGNRLGFEFSGSEKVAFMANGKVGIGTNIPGATLDVASGQVLTPDGTNAAPAIASRNDPDTGFYFTGSDIRATIDGAWRFTITNSYMDVPNTVRFNSTSGTGFNVGGGTDFNIFTNSTDRLTISNTGKVGIGTATPNALLEVNGDVRIGSQTTRATATNRGQLALGSTYLATSATSTTVDWSRGNMQELASFVCDGSNTITFTNMKDGGAYSLLLSGSAAHTGVCNFAGYTFKTSGGAVAPTAGKDVLFTFAVFNTTVVYSMSDNLQ